MIEVSNISYKYPTGSTKVLDDFSLSFADGKIYGLLGENGVGKSTLLALVCGLLAPQRGIVTYNGVNVVERRPSVLSQVIFVQDEFTFPAMSLNQYVRINAPFYPRFDHQALQQCLTDFGMGDVKDLTALSLGQKKKVMLSFALAARPQLLLLDEPTNGLDIPSKALFRRVVAKMMTDDQTIVVSTHQVHDVEQMLDHVVIINNHGILLDASTMQLSEQYVFETCFQTNVPEDVLYAEPSVEGLHIIRPATEQDVESTVNLELLFNAVIAGKLS
ncbi:MAG: ABC transporter ATP-binding protein [Bacteroidales bacterium]|nr:ABC transporter ATP-binding protein [Bacteroidales bacterium]